MMLCNHHLHLVPKYFIIPPKTLLLIKYLILTPPHLPQSLLPLIYILFLRIPLFRIFHINEIIQYDDCFLPLSIVSPSFVHIVAVSGLHYFSLWLSNITLFISCLSIHLLMAVWAVATFWLL